MSDPYVIKASMETHANAQYQFNDRINAQLNRLEQEVARTRLELKEHNEFLEWLSHNSPSTLADFRNYKLVKAKLAANVPTTMYIPRSK